MALIRTNATYASKGKAYQGRRVMLRQVNATTECVIKE